MRSVPGLPIWLPFESQYPADFRPLAAPDCSRVQPPPVIIVSDGAEFAVQRTDGGPPATAAKDAVTLNAQVASRNERLKAADGWVSISFNMGCFASCLVLTNAGRHRVGGGPA